MRPQRSYSECRVRNWAKNRCISNAVKCQWRGNEGEKRGGERRGRGNTLSKEMDLGPETVLANSSSREIIKNERRRGEKERREGKKGRREAEEREGEERRE